MAKRIAPTELDYSKLLPLGVAGTSRMRSFKSTNGTEFSATNSVINIPLNSTGFLDAAHSYLNFKVTLTGTGNVAFDGGSQALFQTLRLIGSNGEELERIDNYNTIQAAFSDLQCSENHTSSYLNAMERHTKTPGLPELATAASYECSVKLMSGLLNCGKYLPLGWLSGGGLTLELTLAPNADCLHQALGNTNAAYTVTNVHYNAQIVTPSSDFNNAFTQLLQRQGGVQFHGVTPRTFNSNFTGNVSEATVSVACRLKSIKSMFTILRVPDQFSVNQATQCQRSLLGMNSYSVKVGAVQYPAQPLQSGTEFYAETAKAIGPLGDVRSANRMDHARYNKSTYTKADATPTPDVVLTADAVTSGFVGLDYETFAQASSILESGLDSSSLALPINVDMKFASAVPAGNIRVTNVILADVIFTLDSQGQISASM